MTVQELIEYLETLPPETKVKVPTLTSKGYGSFTKLKDPVIGDTIYFYESPVGLHKLEIGEES